jgi:hypothetical protein
MTFFRSSVALFFGLLLAAVVSHFAMYDRIASSRVLRCGGVPGVAVASRSDDASAAAVRPLRGVAEVLSLVVARPANEARLPEEVTLPRAASFFPDNPASGRGRFVVVGSQEGWASYVSVEYFQFFRTLRHAYAWEFVDGDSWRELADNLLRDGRSAPAALLFMESWQIASWGSIDSRFRAGGTSMWFFVDDLHWFNEEVHARKSFVLANVADVIVGSYMHLLPSMYPEAASKPRVHSPHAVTSLFMLPLNEAPKLRVLLAGAVSQWYPYRTHVHSKIEAGDLRFDELPHPGYHANLSAMRDAPNVGSNFAASLNNYLAVLTDGLVFNYTVAKAFEIPACGALMLANSELVPVLADLGLHAGTHFLAYSLESLDAVVDWVLSPANRAAVDAIRAEGQALVWARHTVYHRAAALDTAVRLLTQTYRTNAVATV